MNQTKSKPGESTRGKTTRGKTTRGKTTRGESTRGETIPGKTTPGFPRKKKFRTKKQIEAYFAGERIQCLLCGRWFRKIGGPHLTRIHGVTGDEYRKRFSLPPGRPLTGSGRDKKWSAARKWRRGDFKKILTRMRVQRRSLTDVCRDPDLPSFSSWRKYIKHRPEFSERLEALYSKLPFRLQGRAGRLSDQFGEECDRLRRQGMPYEKIAKTLGVTEKPVARALNEFDEKRGLDLRRKPIKLGPRKYQAILDRMIAQQRSMMDVCKDPDLPSYGAWLAYTKTRPEMRAEAKRILYSLPYPVQLATRDLSPRFLVDSLRLRAKGMNRREIADALGSCASVVSRRFKLHFQKKARMKKTDLERLKAEGEKPVKPPRKWKPKDYQRVLQRMRKEKRALGDVCKDPDLPTTGACTAYTKRHPEFARKVEAIYEKMPFSVQKRARKLSPGFRAECERLRGQRWIVSRIAKRLGVSHTTVRRTLKEFDRKTKARDKEAFLRWRTRDYDAILERIREQQRSLTVVCRDPDLPSLKAWISFSEKHPEYAEKLREVYHGMPYSFQSRFGALSPRFRADCERLRAEGMSYKKIAETLGVGSKPVIRVLRERDQKHPRKK